MQNNSNDNLQNWKQRLDDFEETGRIDLNDSWQKLQQRSPVKKSSPKKRWYWLAAACITAISFLLVNMNEEKIQGPAIVKKETIEVKPDIKTLPIETEPIMIDQQRIRPTIIKRSVLKSSQIVAKEESPLPRLVSQTPDIKAPVPLFDTGSRELAKQATPVKKLKQVHINEINSGAGSNASTLQEGKPYYPLTYKAKEVYGGSVNANGARMDRDHIIKIKLFP